MFEMAGHSPFADAPEEFFPALQRFVSGLSVPGDAAVAEWKAAVSEKVAAQENAPEYLLRTAGWGRASSEKLAGKYSKDWLDGIKDSWLLLRLGFALYDVKRYEEALGVFEKVAEVTPAEDKTEQAIAGVWQGHMLDLLGKREEAKAAYAKVVDLNVNGHIRYEQYGIDYNHKSYAETRIKESFTRVENKEGS
jgi:tetratricopeptide (TPR) repeat protein